MSKIIGIDLGTTNCCAAVIVDEKPVVIPNSQGANITPSVVSFEDDGTCLVGEPARRRAVLHPQRTIYSVKRFMGESYDVTQELAESMPYRVGRCQYHQPQFDGGTSWLTPQEVSAEILRTVKHNAEKYLGTSVDEAVITVPAYYNDLQRQATKAAGELAGFKVRRIISEPTAAALAYGLGKGIKDEDVAVFHLGGGTFDISILSIGDGVYEVRSTCGNTHLGGDDFDKAIVDWLAEEFKRDHNIDLRQDPTTLQRLREAAEKAKIELSSSMEAEINLPFITTVDGAPQSLAKTLTRVYFESLCDKLLAALEQPCRTALRHGDFNIKKVLLVGGGTRIPAVQKKIGEIFGMQPSMNVNPDEVVAIGAAIQGAVITGQVKDTLLMDVIPLSLGIETIGGVMTKIIDANYIIPTRKSQIFTTTVDNQTELHLRVLQGERPMANDNKTIARVTLSGFSPAPKGEPQIEVIFDVNSNGILYINAIEKTTGKNINARVESGENITEEAFRRSSDYYAQPFFSSSTASSTSGTSSSNNNQSNTSDTSSSNTRSSSQSNQRSSHSSFTPAYRYTPADSWWSDYGMNVLGILVLVGIALLIFFSLYRCDDQEVPHEVSYESSYTPSDESTSTSSYESPTYPSNKSISYPYHKERIDISIPEPIKHLFPGLSSSFYITCPSVIGPAYTSTPMDSMLKASQKLEEFFKEQQKLVEMLEASQKRREMLRVRRSNISTDTLTSNPSLFQWRKNHLQLKTPSLHADSASSIHHDYEIKLNNLNEQRPVDDNETPLDINHNSTDTTSCTPSTI